MSTTQTIVNKHCNQIFLPILFSSHISVLQMKLSINLMFSHIIFYEAFCNRFFCKIYLFLFVYVLFSDLCVYVPHALSTGRSKERVAAH